MTNSLLRNNIILLLIGFSSFLVFIGGYYVVKYISDEDKPHIELNTRKKTENSTKIAKPINNLPNDNRIDKLIESIKAEIKILKSKRHEYIVQAKVAKENFSAEIQRIGTKKAGFGPIAEKKLQNWKEIHEKIKEINNQIEEKNEIIKPFVNISELSDTGFERDIEEFDNLELGLKETINKYDTNNKKKNKTAISDVYEPAIALSINNATNYVDSNKYNRNHEKIFKNLILLYATKGLSTDQNKRLVNAINAMNGIYVKHVKKRVEKVSPIEAINILDKALRTKLLAYKYPRVFAMYVRYIEEIDKVKRNAAILTKALNNQRLTKEQKEKLKRLQQNYK